MNLLILSLRPQPLKLLLVFLPLAENAAIGCVEVLQSSVPADLLQVPEDDVVEMRRNQVYLLGLFA